MLAFLVAMLGTACIALGLYLLLSRRPLTYGAPNRPILNLLTIRRTKPVVVSRTFRVISSVLLVGIGGFALWRVVLELGGQSLFS